MKKYKIIEETWNDQLGYDEGFWQVVTETFYDTNKRTWNEFVTYFNHLKDDGDLEVHNLGCVQVVTYGGSMDKYARATVVEVVE